jgi:hypothetical protein
LPHRNRVDPWGRLIATTARGAWFGNRGCLHDRNGRITDRRPPTDAWIICRLAFKNRRRPLLQPGRYTELFFLDEATALAAGHRPCGECRHEDLRRFGAAWPGAPAGGCARAGEIDAVLKRERRRDRGEGRFRWLGAGAAPADGLMFCLAERPEEAFLASGGQLWRWTPFGYEAGMALALTFRAVLLTPPSTAAAIARGYRPQIHPSVGGNMIPRHH